MTCTDSCVRPSRMQAHCSVCHRTFGGVWGFDMHRRGGKCAPPADIGLTDDGKGVFRRPPPITQTARFPRRGTPQTPEQASGVPVSTPGPQNPDLALPGDVGGTP